MKNMKNFKLSLITSSLLLASSAFAANVAQDGNGIYFDGLAKTQYSLTIRTPDGETQKFTVNDEQFTINASLLGVKSLADGLYKYELTPINKPGQLAKDVRELGEANVAAEYADAFKSQSEKASGVFSLNNGSLLTGEETRAPVVEKASGANKDQQILDDLLVVGSACIGQDCVNGESFGFDTLRLKENNLRIRALDTSASASFPTRDWQITFNDTSNGGMNKFSIDDIDGGRTPFTIEAGAPTDSLYVEDGGRIGLGTNTPVVQMHVKDGNTPTLRLEQDGSSGFTPLIWDLAGNEANFFIRDATNGSDLPFRIFPNPGSDALVIEGGTGDIGMGTTSPSSNLHVFTNSSGAADMLKLQNQGGGSFITMENGFTGKSWFMTHENSAGTSFNITHSDTGGRAMQLTTGGNMIINGTLTTMGTTCSTMAQPAGCDLVFSDDYQLPTIEDHAAEMYKNSYLPNVGPTKENEPFNLTEKTGGMLNELEKAHIYIAQLNESLKNKSDELELIKERLTKLENK